MRRSRSDTGTKEAVENLRALGVSVIQIQGLGQAGVSDALAGWHGISHLLEFKKMGQGLRESQVEFITRWRGCYHVAVGSAQAFELIQECDERIRRMTGR